MTQRENDVLDLALKWRDSKFAIEEALIEQQLKHAIDMLKKERRDAKPQNAKEN